MKLFVSAAAAALLVAAASSAHAGDMYFQGNAGLVVKGETKLKDVGTGDAEFGFLVSGAAGMNVNDNIAVEGELLFAQNGIDTAGTDIMSAEVRSTLLMANAKYSFPAMGEFVPYVGAGVGYGQVKYEISDGTDEGSDDDNGVAWQLKAGVAITRGEQTVDLGYRYLRAPDYKVDGVQAETGVHALTIGLRF